MVISIILCSYFPPKLFSNFICRNCRHCNGYTLILSRPDSLLISSCILYSCPHGKRAAHCLECGGSKYCEHKKVKQRCDECGVKCDHGKVKENCRVLIITSRLAIIRRKCLYICRIVGVDFAVIKSLDGTASYVEVFFDFKLFCHLSRTPCLFNILGSAFCKKHGARKRTCRKCANFCIHWKHPKHCSICNPPVA